MVLHGIRQIICYRLYPCLTSLVFDTQLSVFESENIRIIHYRTRRLLLSVSNTWQGLFTLSKRRTLGKHLSVKSSLPSVFSGTQQWLCRVWKNTRQKKHSKIKDHKKPKDNIWGPPYPLIHVSPFFWTKLTCFVASEIQTRNISLARNLLYKSTLYITCVYITFFFPTYYNKARVNWLCNEFKWKSC
jgi:hypothetical protein